MALNAPTTTGDGIAATTPLVRRTVWSAILLLAMAVLAGATMRTVFSPLQEAAKLDIGLTDFQISLVQGVAAAVPLALLALPLGWLADRANRVRILITLSTLWTVGTLLTAVAQDFYLLFVARSLAGVAGNFVVPVAISMAADMCMPERRGRSMLLLSLGNVAGGAAAFAIGGSLLGVFQGAGAGVFGLTDWRATTLVFGFAAAVLTLPLLLLREPVRHEVEQAGATVAAIASALWKRRWFLLPLFLGQVGVVMADAAAVIWAAPVLIRDFGQSPTEFAGWMGAALLLAGVLGSVLGGFAADAGHKLKLRGGILLGAIAAAVLTIPAALYPVMPSVGLFGLMFTLLLAGGTVAGLVTATAIAVLVPNEERGLCLGAFMILGALIGLGIAPLLVTLGSQALGGEAHLAPALAIVSVIVSILSTLGFVIAFLNAPRPVAEEIVTTN